MHRCSTVLLCLFFIINVPTYLSSMELPLIDFKHMYRKQLIKECKKYGFNYDEQETTNDAISQVFNITKQLNKNKNDHEIYTLIKKQAPHFVAHRLAFYYMATKGLPNKTLSHIARYVYKDFALPPLLESTLGGNNAIRKLALNSDGTLLYIECANHSINELNLKNFKAQTTFKTHKKNIAALILAHDNKTLYAGFWDSTIKGWSVNSGKKKVTFSDMGYTCLAISPDDTTLYTGGCTQPIRLWNLKTFELMSTYPMYANALALSPDGNLLYVGSTNKKGIKIFDIRSKKELPALGAYKDNAIIKLAISLDGNTLCSARTDNTIQVWNLLTGKEQASLKGHSDFIGTLVLSNDSKTLYSGSVDNTIKVWNLVTGKEQYTLKGHTGHINHLIISPDGNRLYSGSQDGTIKIWRLNPNIPILDTHDWRLMLYKSLLVIPSCFPETPTSKK